LLPQGKLDHTAFSRDFRTDTTTEVTAATPYLDRKSASNAVESLARADHSRRQHVLDLKQYRLDAD
jgi:hypothetical protein